MHDRLDERNACRWRYAADVAFNGLIVYWTVTVGAAGDLHFARDVYNLDASVLRGLDSAVVNQLNKTP